MELNEAPQSNQQSEGGAPTEEEIIGLFEQLAELKSALQEIQDDLSDVLPSDYGGNKKTLSEPILKGFEAAHATAGELYDLATHLDEYHTYILRERVDPIEVIKRLQQEGEGHDTFCDNWAAEVWTDHEECDLSELRALEETLGEIAESLRGEIAWAVKGGDDPEDITQKMQDYVRAYYRSEVLRSMIEQAALNGGEVPPWERVNWKKRVGRALEADPAPRAAIRCLYFLLVQRAQEYDGVSKLYRRAAEIFGISREALIDRLKRGLGTGLLRSLPNMPESVDDWRDWLEAQEGETVERLRIDVPTLQGDV